MISIGERIMQLRKQHNLSQQDLALKIGVSRTIVGNYERNINTPSIEIFIAIARVFNVSLDYLAGEGQLHMLDRNMLRRIEDIERLDDDTRQHLFFLVDCVIRNFKMKEAVS